MKNQLGDFVDAAVQKALLETHTAFLAKVLRVLGNRADLQPLHLASEKQSGMTPWPMLAAVPKLRGVSLAVGDVCLCVVCERELGMALAGEMSLPAARHHELSDSVIVGVVEG